jgi:hypothetical protein
MTSHVCHKNDDERHKNDENRHKNEDVIKTSQKRRGLFAYWQVWRSEIKVAKMGTPTNSFVGNISHCSIKKIH